MFKTSGSTKSTTRPGKGGVGVDGDGGDDGGHDNSATSSSSSTDSSTSATQIAVEYDGVGSGGGKWVEESSKKSKNLKGLKSCKGHRFRGMFTKTSILRQFDTKISSSH